MDRLRVVDRSVAAGYRRDWRGVLAYWFTPEAWTTPAFTIFVMAVGAFICLVMVEAATTPKPFLQLPVKAVFGYFFVVRPVLAVAGRRTLRQSSPEDGGSPP